MERLSRAAMVACRAHSSKLDDLAEHHDVYAVTASGAVSADVALV